MFGWFANTVVSRTANYNKKIIKKDAQQGASFPLSLNHKKGIN
jgi:hypothetical protein